MQQMTFDLYEERPTFLIACGERPQRRLENFGAAALSDTELIALLLQPGLADDTSLRIASELIAGAGSIAGLAGWQAEDFRRQRGIGRNKARQLAALVEIGRRMMKGPLTQPPIMDRAEAIVDYLLPYTRGLQVEKFWVLCLNRKNRLKKLVEVTSGTATSSLVHPREVFKIAIQYGATAVACVHNHPSGDPGPSSADIQVTRQLREASRTIAIDLLDHLIVGEKSADPAGLGYYSFRSAGLL